VRQILREFGPGWKPIALAGPDRKAAGPRARPAGARTHRRRRGAYPERVPSPPTL